ncbi:hypothetical protein KBB96_06475 [Luteolibacter ambystomatis]|uniref:Uncharacterized protein n=1 Tax=Luteolibacter ambystomatis TaxID=2824561 RepID=A0A975J216_9BACT|nr:hypothetical protein [Luteolibacter ambystomatis]QUE52534.1 hypothetical protein KBB96_06475 [Luteolibacter ambystomatis]
MARDPEQVRLKVVDDMTAKPGEVVRLKPSGTDFPRAEPPSSQPPGRVLLHSASPAATPLPVPEKLEVPRTSERRTHDPGIDSLIEDTTVVAKPLEETWNDRERARRPTPWGWFALFGLICGGAVVWSLVHLSSNSTKPETARDESVARLEQDARENAAAEVRVDRITDTARSFVAAASIDQMLPLVRQPERVRPLMEGWYARHPLTRGRFKSLSTFRPITLGDRASFWQVGCLLADETTRELIIEELPDGKMAVDWETSVIYQPMDWNDYTRDRPTGSFDFRVILQSDVFFSHEFSDSTRWSNFRLSTLGGEDPLYGYCQRDSETERYLQNLISRNRGRPVALVIRISTPPDLKSPRGVVIEKVMSEHWVYLTPPDA